jgi:hypothetical protein
MLLPMTNDRGGGAGDGLKWRALAWKSLHREQKVGIKLPNFLTTKTKPIKTIKYRFGTYTGEVDSTGQPKGQGTFTSSNLTGVSFKSSSWDGNKVNTTVQYDEDQKYEGDLEITPSGQFEKHGDGVYTYNTPLPIQDKKIKRIECKWIRDEIDIKNSVIITYDDDETYLGYINRDYTPVTKQEDIKMEEITEYFDNHRYRVDPLLPYQLSTRILRLPDIKKREILAFLTNKFIKEPSNSGLPVLLEHLQASTLFKELFHAINVGLLFTRRDSTRDIKTSYSQIKSDVLQSVMASEFRDLVIRTPDTEIITLGILYNNYAAIVDKETDSALLASIVRKVHSYAADPIKKIGDLNKKQATYTEKLTSGEVLTDSDRDKIAADLQKINQEIVTNQETIDRLLAPIDGQKLGIAVKKNNYGLAAVAA